MAGCWIDLQVEALESRARLRFLQPLLRALGLRPLMRARCAVVDAAEQEAAQALLVDVPPGHVGAVSREALPDDEELGVELLREPKVEAGDASSRGGDGLSGDGLSRRRLTAARGALPQARGALPLGYWGVGAGGLTIRRRGAPRRRSGGAAPPSA